MPHCVLHLIVIFQTMSHNNLTYSPEITLITWLQILPKYGINCPQLLRIKVTNKYNNSTVEGLFFASTNFRKKMTKISIFLFWSFFYKFFFVCNFKFSVFNKQNPTYQLSVKFQFQWKSVNYLKSVSDSFFCTKGPFFVKTLFCTIFDTF